MVDLTKGFFFCYEYPLSNYVQRNVLAASNNLPLSQQTMFVWNTYLLEEFQHIAEAPWYIYLIHGVFLQQNCVQQERQFQLTLIGRRSRSAW